MGNATAIKVGPHYLTASIDIVDTANWDFVDNASESAAEGRIDGGKDAVAIEKTMISTAAIEVGPAM